MKRGTLVILALTAIALLAAITLGIVLLGPISSKLSALSGQAREGKAALARLEGSAVGEEFERDLRIFAGRRADKAAEVESVRARLAFGLDMPFRDMKIAAGASRPASDEFQRAYNFHGDQLRGRIRDFVSRAGGAEVKEIPLISPSFSSGAELDVATMRRLQRFANIEARVLETAAKAGSAPISVIRLEEEPPPPEDADAGYERLRIGLDLLSPEGRVSPLVHGLLACFDEFGGITKLVGLVEAPVAEGRLKEHPATPAKRIAVTLSLGFPTPIEDTR